MLAMGDVKRAKEIGLKGGKLYTWTLCSDCQKGRWVHWGIDEPRNPRCRNCAGKLLSKPTGEYRPGWKGGRYLTTAGYIKVRLYPDDFFYPMASKQGMVLEHRLVMAKSLNRCLLPWEVVHHRNGIKDDNERENLELLPGRLHLVDRNIKRRLTAQDKEIKHLKARVALLEANNTLLEATIAIVESNKGKR